MLIVQNLESGYGKMKIINGVSFEVKRGEIVAIIGRNGVGKTTLIKTILGLIRPMEGRIFLAESQVDNLPAYERVNLGLGYVPQGRGVFPQLTVEENLKMGQFINIRNPEKKTLEPIYDYFPRLKERRRQRAGTLSGGEQSMLAIGRALVGNPVVMLLDEPSEGVQPNIVHQIGVIIEKINREWGLTIVFVEQNISLIQQIAQRCYAIDKGTIVGEIPAERIYDDNILHQYLSV